MKAIIYTKYGSPNVLQLKEVDKPIQKDDEVLIKVHAVALNSYDYRLLRADPFLIRFMGGGMLKPKNTVLGADVSGCVEEVGRNVHEFQRGDEVYGCLSSCGNGGLAEYTCASESALALKPTNISFEAAASVPMAALTALQGLRDKGQIQSGQKVLINGASGGVGTFAVQIAKSLGAEVTGVCSTKKLDLARSIGADQVIDYTQADFTNNGQQYDLILDVAANRSVSDYKRALSPNGNCVVVGFSTILHMVKISFQGNKHSKPGNKRIGLAEMEIDSKDLIFMNKLLESGEVKPMIDRLYKLSEAADAMRYIGMGHASGKVVITVLQ